MLKRLWISLKRDIKMNISNGYLLITIIIALLYLAVVRFAVPEQLSASEKLYLLDNTPEQVMSAFVQANAKDEALVVSSREEMEALLAENDNGVGMILKAGDPLPSLTMIFQPHHNDKVRMLGVASAEAEIRAIYGTAPSDITISTATLNPGFAESIPFNKSLVTVLLYSDPAMIGLLFVAVLYFLEKQQGTVKAYMVTPGHVWEYVLSKAIALALLAVLFSLILAPLGVGAGINYWALLGLIFAGSILSSLIGTLLSAFFTDIGQFFGPAIVAIVFLSLPGVSYYLPNFSPWWLRLHPTYAMLFGLKEALFPSGNTHIIITGLITLLSLDVVMLFISSAALDRRFVRR